MPPFRLVDGNGRLIGMLELLEDTPIIAIFVCGPWCPYCHALAIAFGDVDTARMKVVAITSDAMTRAETSAWETATGLHILTDIDCGYALSLNLAMLVDRRALPIENHPARAKDDVREARMLLPMPAIFIIDQAGVIRFRHVNADHRPLPEPAALAAAALTLCSKKCVSPRLGSSTTNPPSGAGRA